MTATRSLFSTIFLFCYALVSAQFTDVINSNRPGESMSAFSVGKTVIQGELGFLGIKEDYANSDNESKGINSELVVRYGAILEQLEFIAELQHQYDDYEMGGESYSRSGFKTAILGAKYLIYDPNKKYIDRKPNLLSWKANHGFKWRNLIPAVGVYVGANLSLSDKFPPEDQPNFSPKGMIITQNQLGRYVLVTNIIMDRFGSNYETLGYVVTMTYGINDRWSAFIENQGFKRDVYSDMIFRGGAAYLLKENIQIDLSFGANVKDSPSILNAGIGLSWRFDANYEDVIIRLPGEDKPEDKDKKDKKKKKKRKDAVETETETPTP